MTENGRCVFCKQSPVTEGEKSCANLLCRTQMQLSEIPGLYVLALAFLTPGKGGHGSSGSERTIGVNITALEYRIALDLLAIVSGWEVEVRDKREFSEMATVSNYTERITQACEFLLAQFTWISRQEFFGDFATEIADMHAKGRAATRQFTEKLTRIKCPTSLEEYAEGGEEIVYRYCGQTLTLGKDPLAIVKCRNCGVEWTTLFLVRVALETPSEPMWMDSEAIASLLGITSGQVVRIAKSDKKSWKGDRANRIYDLQKIIELRGKAI